MTLENCTQCEQPMHPLETFPGKVCQGCYERKMDAVPLSQLDRPDFIRIIQK